MHEITVVSGLPRSGTSLMMKMLAAAGCAVLTDRLRQADASNPKGYYEYEKVKRLRQDNSWLAEAAGKAVKVVSALLPYLPEGYRYRVVFMERNLGEVIESQRQMLARQGRQPAAADSILAEQFRIHLEKTKAWLAAQPHFVTCYLSYNGLLADPEAELTTLNRFFDQRLPVAPMLAVIDPTLYRARVKLK